MDAQCYDCPSSMALDSTKYQYKCYQNNYVNKYTESSCKGVEQVTNDGLQSYFDAKEYCEDIAIGASLMRIETSQEETIAEAFVSTSIECDNEMKTIGTIWANIIY